MGDAFRELARTLDPAEAWFAVAIAAALAAFLLWQAFRALRRARVVEDTPTSLIRSAAQGYCELFGHGEVLPGAPIRAPLTGRTCLWWAYSVEEKVRSGKNTHWRVLEQDVSGSLFALDDPTGRCVVDPDGAEVIGPQWPPAWPPWDSKRSISKGICSGRSRSIGGRNKRSTQRIRHVE